MSVSLLNVEPYRDPYFGDWLITSAPAPLPLWQATSPSYKGGTATITAMSKQELMAKIEAFVKAHDRLIATRGLANTVQTTSIVAAVVGAIAYGAGKYFHQETAEKGGMVVGGLGVAGLLGAMLLHARATSNEAAG